MSNKKEKKAVAVGGTHVFDKVNEFFTFYLTERNLEKTLGMLSDNVYSIGTGEGEVAIGKKAFRNLLIAELQALKEPIGFTIEEYNEQKRGENCWDCILNMTTRIAVSGSPQMKYPIRVSMSLHLEENDYFIDVMHASEASAHQELGEFFPLKLMSDYMISVNEKTRADLLKIIEQLIPGGVVGGYVEEGFPLYAANEQLLKMAGYSSYEEFEQDIQGRIINSIHPEDRDYVNNTLEHIFEYKDQYEIQYRMKKKDGSYIWVNDIGKLTRDESGKMAIISVITDISEQLTKRKRMEKEMSRDSLTGLYNRKSGEERIGNALSRSQQYLFFMLDLDNFKQVNDIYGHDQGDKVLRMFGKLAMESFRKEDTVCRMGGDEFIIFVCETSDIDTIMRKMTLLIDEYKKAIEKKWPMSHSTLSAGGVWSDTYHDFKELYKAADKVLYEVKNEKKGMVKLRSI